MESRDLPAYLWKKYHAEFMKLYPDGGWTELQINGYGKNIYVAERERNPMSRSASHTRGATSRSLRSGRRPCGGSRSKASRASS